jgi:hypothetical protein
MQAWLSFGRLVIGAAPLPQVYHFQPQFLIDQQQFTHQHLQTSDLRLHCVEFILHLPVSSHWRMVEISNHKVHYQARSLG